MPREQQGNSQESSGTFEPDYETMAREILDFEPFAGGENKDGGKPEDGSPSNDEGGQEGTPPASGDGAPKARSGEEQNPPADPGAKPQVPPTPDPVQQQLAQIQEMLAAKPEPEAKPAKAGDDKPTPPKFNFQVPKAILDGMASEDEGERGQAVSVLVNGLANAIYTEAMKEVQTLQQNLVKSLPAMLAEREVLRQQQERIVQDFYSTYDGYDIPAFKPTVAQMALHLAKAKGPAFKGWTPEFRDELAGVLQASFPMIPAKKAASGGTPPPAKQNGAGKTPAFAAGRGTRPSNSGGDSPEVRDMMDTIFGG